MLGLSLTESDWLWPESHASPALVAAVLGIVYAGGADLHIIRSVWSWPKYRQRDIGDMFGSVQNLDETRAVLSM
jgi:hypothetical protein